MKGKAERRKLKHVIYAVFIINYLWLTTEVLRQENLIKYNVPCYQCVAEIRITHDSKLELGWGADP